MEKTEKLSCFSVCVLDLTFELYFQRKMVNSASRLSTRFTTIVIIFYKIQESLEKGIYYSSFFPCLFSQENNQLNVKKIENDVLNKWLNSYWVDANELIFLRTQTFKISSGKI